MVIIIIQNPTQGSTQGKARVTGWEGQPGMIRVNIRINIVMIIVLKPNLGVDPGQDQGHGLGGSTQVDPSQRMDKNNYYHNLKTWLGGRLGARFFSRVWRVNPSSPKLKKIYQSNLVLTNKIQKTSMDF